MWSDEILASYEVSLVAANHVKKLSMKGKKGDTIHIPRPDRGTASLKVVENAVNLQAGQTDTLPLVVNKHYEYSRQIEDFAELQARSDLRRFYTEDAGYALAKRVDTDLLNLGVGFGDGDQNANPLLPGSWEHSQSFIPAAGPAGLAPFVAGGPATALTDPATIIESIRILDEQDVPGTNRTLIVHPTTVADLRKIDEFISADYVDGKPTQSGKVGMLYGVDIYVSTNVPEIEAGIFANYLFHRDALVLVEQQGIRSQTQYKQEYLATLYTADRVYGCATYRPESGIVLAVGR